MIIQIAIGENNLGGIRGKVSLQIREEKDIPFIFQAAALLAAFTHLSYIVIYAPGDSFTCRRDATRNLLGIVLLQC
ncbi:hypothetical protein [Photorhabdus luminescens]|uniref:Uncharacterized protein n=1 Tax=Photorhabdus luminescens subsp. sonorensis TaxID=1173677 RepID=A0A5C4RCC0_PHOLU|nr:hypothetical protein [Photorhabdus luminescens]TNH41640.1 hypothetical protein EP164_21380 [Photorhabdus luminescens subsp. sonorensis]